MKNMIQHILTWQQKAKIFFDKNYGWILLITGILAFILVERGDFLSEMAKGWNDGYNNKCKDCNNSNDSQLVLVISSFFVLLLFGVFLYGIGEIFYHIFFKYILQKGNTVYVLAFIIWFLFFYNLFWESIYWSFNKNNAFVDRFSAVKSIDSKNAVQELIKDYRENYATILTALCFLLIITYGLVKNYVTNTKTQAKLIAQKSQAELMALKAQINPHFLFNVLNNLYGSAIVEDSPKTSEGILQLSSIMRHVVEGTKNERIDVEKEIRFLNDYIELNKMRIPNRPNIRIITEIFWDENPTMIAPLLVIPYLENAFKYGISTTEECFIEMSFRVENQQLSFSCKNSIMKTDDKLEVGTGTGLDNTKRRLDLYYPTAYQLSTSSSENVFVVNLEVNL
jgi:sensor histidine kinase YesM